MMPRAFGPVLKIGGVEARLGLMSAGATEPRAKNINLKATETDHHWFTA